MDRKLKTVRIDARLHEEIQWYDLFPHSVWSIQAKVNYLIQIGLAVVKIDFKQECHPVDEEQLDVVTGVIDRHRGLLASLGERFITYRCPDISDKEKRERCKIASGNTKVSQYEQEMKKAAMKVLEKRSNVEIDFPENFRLKIIDVASFVAKARCSIHRDKYTKEPEFPSPEVPTRLTKQLHDLACGITVAREKTVVTEHEIKLVQKIALDCLTLKRIKIFKFMLKRHPNPVKTAQVAGGLKVSVSIAQQWLEDLHKLDLVNKSSELDSSGLISNVGAGKKKPFLWSLKDADLLQEIWG